MHKNKISECNVINSVNPLNLRIVDIKGRFEKGKDDVWYVVISDKDDVYKKLVDILESIKNKIMERTWDALEYDKDYPKIKFESNNIFPKDKDVNIHVATIVIRAIFAKNGKYYPQLFLDDGLYKMLVYETIDISDGIDVNKSDESKECMLCHYWYLLDKSFSCGPYLYDGCYNMMQKCNKLKNIAIIRIKKVYPDFFFCL